MQYHSGERSRTRCYLVGLGAQTPLPGAVFRPTDPAGKRTVLFVRVARVKADNRLTKTTEGTVSAGYTYDAQNSGKSVVKTTICEVMTKMEYFNILYEGDKEDVDIICVPDFIASKIGIVSQLFLEWLPNADSKMYWTTIDGHECSVCETEGFVKWINKQYCENKQKAFIVEQHVSLIKEYRTVEF